MKDMVQVRRPGRSPFDEPSVSIGRSQFDRSHGLKTTFDASFLVPILVDEVLPGDTFTCKLNGFARIFSPLDAPVMDNIELETFFFFVPNRILWEHWVDMMGEHVSAGGQDTTYTVPILATGLVVDHDHQHGASSAHFLAAFMGLPDGLTSASTNIISLPFRAYNQIYNHWFRDQSLIDERNEHLADSADPIASYRVERSAKKHDYFTSCLPYLEKGTSGSVSRVALFGSPKVTTEVELLEEVGVWSTAESDYKKLKADSTNVALQNAAIAASEVLYVDLSTAGFIDVNKLRQTVAIQRMLEKDARGGTRYVEIIKTQFGVTSPDFRLQNPEYLGGGKSFITVSPIANTSSTAGEDQGELRGIGTGVIQGHGWAKSFTEHGYVIGIIRARGDVTYFQGIDKMWGRSNRFDFYTPDLAHLGEQSVLNKEIYRSNLNATDIAVFGYQERWAEYRHKNSRICGNLNSDVTGGIDFWHIAEDFGSLPVLNTTFIEDQTPMTRVTTVSTEPDFLLDLWFDYKCARPIPVRSIPSLMGGRF